MIGLDTNLLVRFLARDDAEQAERAERLLRRENVWIARAVLLETEWILRFSYQQEPARIHDADALPLAACSELKGFATFDKALLRKVRRVVGSVPVISP